MHARVRLHCECVPFVRTGWAVGEFSSLLPTTARSALLESCIRNEVNILVSSDGMSRGVDLPNVAYVVNYDIPSHFKTYVHRVGRTARAGRDGVALTLVQSGQVRSMPTLPCCAVSFRPLGTGVGSAGFGTDAPLHIIILVCCLHATDEAVQGRSEALRVAREGAEAGPSGRR